MGKKSIIRGCVAGAAVALLTLTGAGAAQALPVELAAPTPDRGPDSGGTEVVLELPAGPRWAQVDTGRSHAVGLGTDGLLYTWGSSDQEATTEPRRVPTPEGVTFDEISVGTVINLALASDGTVYSWNGLIPSGAVDPAELPVAVELPGGIPAQQVSAGRNFRSVLGADGRVYGWGVNSEGALGDGTKVSKDDVVEAQLPEAVRIEKIAAGGEHVVALATDGTVWAWGNDSTGALSSGTPERNKLVPTLAVPFTAADPATDIAATLGDGSGSSFALNASSAPFGTGRNFAGETGTGTPASEVRTFTAMGAGDLPATGFAEISGGGDSGAAIGKDGRLYVWGATGAQTATLGGDLRSPRAAVMPEGVERLHGLEAGMYAVTAIGDDGEVYLWGKNPGAVERQQAEAIGEPEVSLENVDFGGTAATAIEQLDATHWSVTTPAHTAGTFDVTVEWSIGGAPQEPIVTEDGFSFIGAPVVHALQNASVAPGGTAVFDLSLSGFPEPGITWEVALPADEAAPQARALRAVADWQPISADPAATVSPDGRSLSVAATAAHDGAQYRATATNDEGSATTNAALLSIVTDGGGTDGGGDGGTDGGADGSGNGSGSGSGSSSATGAKSGSLARTGDQGPALLALLGAGAALTGAALLLARRIARRA